MSGKYEIDMCEGALLPKILKCAVPLIFTNLLQILYNAADVIVVGRYTGQTALAAVGSTSSLINIVINMLIGLSVGASIVASQYIGANNRKKTSDTVHTSLLLALIGGTIFGVLGLFISKPMLALTGSPHDVIDQATLYMKIYFLGTPGLMVANYGTALLRCVGDTKRPFIYFSISGILNVLLNLIFVIIFDMGVAGVAWATIISKYLVAILIVVTLLKNEGFIYLNIKELKIKKEAFFEVLKKGVPVGLQAMVFSGSNVIIQSSINSFGSVVMAGNAAATNIENFLYTAMNAFCHVTTTFVAQNYGAKKYKRMDKSFIISAGLVTLIGVSVGLLIIPFERFLIGIYAPGNEAAISYGVIRFKCIFHIYFLCGLMETATGALRGMGKTVASMLISIVCVVGIRIAWIFTVFKALKTLESLFVSYSLSWLAAIVILTVTYIVLRRKLQKQKESQ